MNEQTQPGASWRDRMRLTPLVRQSLAQLHYPPGVVLS
jgi:hypothetical protein